MARRKKNPIPPKPIYGIRRPKRLRPDEEDENMEEATTEDRVNGEKSAPETAVTDEGTGRVLAFRAAFKDRLKTYGVRYQPGASESGTNFNRGQTSEKIADHNDSQRVAWITEAPPGKDTFFGADVRNEEMPMYFHLTTNRLFCYLMLS